MTVTITIRCDNAAFDEAPLAEVARMLTVLGERIMLDVSVDDLNGRKLYDINGNAVGRVFVSETDA